MHRFLHAADWQVGCQYSNFAPDDSVLVAGDVFDAQTVDRTIRRLFNALGNYAGPWIFMPGNHDEALTESVWTHAQSIGAVVDIARAKVCLWYPRLA